MLEAHYIKKVTDRSAQLADLMLELPKAKSKTVTPITEAKFAVGK